MIEGAFDIETAEWSRFRCGALRGIDGIRYLSWDENKFFDALMQREGEWYAHAGGGFDALWAVEMCAKRGIGFHAVPRGSGLLRVSIEGGPTLVDSVAIWPDRLETCAKVTNVRKLGLGLPCECHERTDTKPDGCGGYCALARPLYRHERARVEEYLLADVDACLAFVCAVHERAERDGIVLKATVGSTAWATAAAWCGLGPATHSPGRYVGIRHGYYGGRVEVYRPRARHGWRYDIHSSYPAALSRTVLPVGTCRFVSGPVASRHYAEARPGIYYVTCLIPPSHSPPLPVRLPTRLHYPHGRVTGAWTDIELRHAEECGAIVERVHKAYTWNDTAPVLAPYARRIWDLRDAAISEGTEAGAAWGKWYKWVANSLTGKLAQRPGFGKYTFHPHPVDPDIVKALGSPKSVTKYGLHFETKTSRLSPCAHVEHAAYLTAVARTELHRQLLEAGDAAIYCDTDSVYSTKPLTRRVGDDLGEWGCEGELHDWTCAAPKLYRYRDEKGKTRVKGKGMPGLTSEGFDDLLSGKAWTVERGVNRYRTARRKESLFERRRLTRAIGATPGWCGARLWDGAEATTRPPEFGQEPPKAVKLRGRVKVGKSRRSRAY